MPVDLSERQLNEHEVREKEFWEKLINFYFDDIIEAAADKKLDMETQKKYDNFIYLVSVITTALETGKTKDLNEQIMNDLKISAETILKILNHTPKLDRSKIQ